MRKATIPAVIMFAVLLAHSQTFEAASVKPTAPPDRNGEVNMGTEGGPGTADPVRIQYRYLTLKTLLMTAFNVKTYRISGPAWIDTERFDIVATLPPGAAKDQLAVMLQNLPAERFKIALHRETKELPMYSLTLAKSGPKMKQSTESPAGAAPPRSRPRIGPDGFVVLENVPASAPIGII